jgi:hypothetical protein
MRFIVCARNRSDGDTFVVGKQSYPDKDAAISALGGSASLDGLADCELFVLDLDAATPVVLVHTRQEPVPELIVSRPADLHEDEPADAASRQRFGCISSDAADTEYGDRRVFQPLHGFFTQQQLCS